MNVIARTHHVPSFEFRALIDHGPTEPFVVYNDAPWKIVKEYLDQVDCVVISPGPGHPAVHEDIGVCSRILEEFDGPILGICMGLQAMVVTFGGKVIHAPSPMHGRLSRMMYPENSPKSQLFHGISESFRGVRYNSLVCERASLPKCLRIICESEDDLVMGLQYRNRAIYGVQFHPESICTENGVEILQNFHDICTDFQNAQKSRPTQSRSGLVNGFNGNLSNHSTVNNNGPPISSEFVVISRKLAIDFEDP
eukprot:328950_1